VRFWDASAIVPLLAEEPRSAGVEAIWQRDPEMTVWWGTQIECASAVARLEREGQLASRQAPSVLATLDDLVAAWSEIEPAPRVREIALRLLRTHPLRAADALQLAAAIVAAEESPSSLRFVTLDTRLGDAAAREGFPVEVPGQG
jgi:uncharacterized protein